MQKPLKNLLISLGILGSILLLTALLLVIPTLTILAINAVAGPVIPLTFPAILGMTWLTLLILAIKTA